MLVWICSLDAPVGVRSHETTGWGKARNGHCSSNLRPVGAVTKEVMVGVRISGEPGGRGVGEGREGRGGGGGEGGKGGEGGEGRGGGEGREGREEGREGREGGEGGEMTMKHMHGYISVYTAVMLLCQHSRMYT